MFGGVQDEEKEGEDDDSDDEGSGNFFNDLYSVQVSTRVIVYRDEDLFSMHPTPDPTINPNEEKNMFIF